MDILDGTIWHQQSMFKIKVHPILRSPLDCLFHERHVFRMNPLENKFHLRRRGPVVLKDSKALL